MIRRPMSILGRRAANAKCVAHALGEAWRASCAVIGVAAGVRGVVGPGVDDVEHGDENIYSKQAVGQQAKTWTRRDTSMRRHVMSISVRGNTWPDLLQADFALGRAG